MKPTYDTVNAIIAYYMGLRKGLQEASLFPCACPITCRTYPSKLRYIFRGKKQHVPFILIVKLDYHFQVVLNTIL